MVASDKERGAHGPIAETGLHGMHALKRLKPTVRQPEPFGNWMCFKISTKNARHLMLGLREQAIPPSWR